jgi:hypothetical protein
MSARETPPNTQPQPASEECRCGDEKAKKDFFRMEIITLLNRVKWLNISFVMPNAFAVNEKISSR